MFGYFDGCILLPCPSGITSASESVARGPLGQRVRLAIKTMAAARYGKELARRMNVFCVRSETTDPEYSSLILSVHMRTVPYTTFPTRVFLHVGVEVRTFRRLRCGHGALHVSVRRTYPGADSLCHCPRLLGKGRSKYNVQCTRYPPVDHGVGAGSLYFIARHQVDSSLGYGYCYQDVLELDPTSRGMYIYPHCVVLHPYTLSGQVFLSQVCLKCLYIPLTMAWSRMKVVRSLSGVNYSP